MVFGWVRLGMRLKCGVDAEWMGGVDGVGVCVGVVWVRS